MSTLNTYNLKSPDSANTNLALDASGNVAIQAGSASAPSIYVAGDSNTGLYSLGADQLAVTTGGTGRLFIDSSGRVGIGTSTPSTTAHVAGSLTVDDRILLQRESGGIAFAVANYWNGTTNPLTGPKGDIVAIGNVGGDGVAFVNANTERMRLTSTGLGIGTTSPAKPLEVRSASGIGQIRVGRSDSSTFNYDIGRDNDASGFLYFYGNQTGATGFVFSGADGERARIDSSGRLLVGTSSTSSVGGSNAQLQSEIIDSTHVRNISAVRNGGTVAAAGPTFTFGRSRGTSLGSLTSVANGDNLGYLRWAGADGSSLGSIAAEIVAEVDGTPGTNDMPGRLVFSTTADGASSPTERMRITNDGTVLIQMTSASSASDGCYFNSSTDSNFHQVLCHSSATSGLANLYLNRQNTDGTLIDFRHADITEGTISVSGTTVSYNGGHIARWSQLLNDEDPSSILKGTVMSNLDEMCEWGDEDNEQLNKTKVSNLEADPNVAGVFVSTSFSEEGPFDFLIGMTGDMVIRIAAGTAVQRGDLLMSAGDGTAKPQDDDIIRSKTIAKVTSTNVSCTYDDGSYCVPCVLMAC